MNITLIEERDIHQWEHDLGKFPARPFISALWLESFRNSKRHPVYLRFVSGGKTLGLIAGLSIEPPYPILKKLYRIIYFFNGPLVIPQDNGTVNCCLGQLTAFARDKGYSHLNFGSYDYPYSLSPQNLPFHQRVRQEYIVDLRGDISDVRKKIKKTIREKVKKSEKNGLTFHQSDSPKFIENLLSLLESTKSVRVSKGYGDYSYYYMPYFDRHLLEKLLENRIAHISYIRKADEILCAELMAVYRNRAYSLLVGTSPEGYELGANAFLWFKDIEQLKHSGFESFNLGGIAEDSAPSGLIFFKTAFGAEKHLCSGGFTPHLQGRFFNLLTDLYKKTSETEIMKTFADWISGK